MRLAFSLVLGLVLVAIAAYAGYRIGTREESAEIARIAAVNVERSTRIRKGLDPKVSKEAV